MKADWGMHRSFDAEILDSDSVPADVAERAYRGLRLTHKLLGNTAALIRAMKRDPLPVRRVLGRERSFDQLYSGIPCAICEGSDVDAEPRPAAAKKET